MVIIQESHEDYLKAIYLISRHKKGGWVSNAEISNFLKIKPSSVTNMLHKLKKNNFIEWRPRKSLRLSSKGKQIAIITVKKYNDLKEFFIKNLNLDDNVKLDEICCKIEHHFTPKLLEALSSLRSKKNHADI